MKRPNILLIMADQLRADWLGCSGNDLVRTPHMDRLAEEGTRFVRASCNSPLCAPSRASIACGLYPYRTGVLNNEVNYPDDLTTYYQLLRRAGYRVGLVGKTDLHKPIHFYGRNGDIPFLYHLGFTDIHETEGKVNAAQFQRYEFRREAAEERPVGPYQRYLKAKGLLDRFVSDYRHRADEATVWHARRSVLNAEDYHDSYIGRMACEFLSRVDKESPWHAFVSFVGPHDPWDAPDEYAAVYEETRFPEAVHDEMREKPGWIRERRRTRTGDVTEDRIQEVRRHYSGMVTLIDSWIGRIIETLEKRHLLANTVVILTSDHGEMLGDHGLFQKQVMYEPSLRVPLIIRDPAAGPGANGGSSESHALAELVDLFPTILDYAGVEYESSRAAGMSLVPVVRNAGEADTNRGRCTGRNGVHKELQYAELENTRMVFDGPVSYTHLRAHET